MTPAPRTIARACFRTKKPPETRIEVHFNPASLQYTVSNTMKDAGQGSKKQYVSQTTAKLTMDLLFDTTHTGQDVRGAARPAQGVAAGTDQLARLLKPAGPAGRQVPPTVVFSWGAYTFTGVVDQYKETLDYFSPEGVPLRAAINLTLTAQDEEVTFDNAHNPNAAVDGALDKGEAQLAPAPAGPGGGPAGVSNALGDPRAARAIAAANGSASLRFSAGADLAVSAGGGVSLSGAAAFSSGASAGLGAGAGFGIGAGGGAGFGAGASAGAGFGARGSFGFSAAAGASGGAFAGLRSGGGAAATGLPGAGSVLAARASASMSAAVPVLSSLSSVGAGGRALAQGGASLSADVGGGTALSASLRFDG